MIEQTAIIEQGAVVGTNVKIGHYCIIGSEVVLKTGVQIKSHTRIYGKTTIGENTIIDSFCSIGGYPQDFSYKLDKTELIIEENCIIRENVVIHTGTIKGGAITKIGKNAFIMCGTHIAHDCQIGKNVIISPNSAIGGHVVVDDFANISALVAIHPMVRVGKTTMLGGGGAITTDVLPYALSDRNGYVIGANIIGLKRSGANKDTIKCVSKAFNDLIYSTVLLVDLKQQFLESKISEINNLGRFLNTPSKRGINRGKRTK